MATKRTAKPRKTAAKKAAPRKRAAKKPAAPKVAGKTPAPSDVPRETPTPEPVDGAFRSAERHDVVCVTCDWRGHSSLEAGAAQLLKDHIRVKHANRK